MDFFMIPGSVIMADEGGVPNDNAGFGQVISEAAQEFGGIGEFVNNSGEAKTFDWNGDGKTNGLDWVFIIRMIKESF